MRLEKHRYYAQKILNTMASIENEDGGRMFHYIFPDLEKEFWTINDKKDGRKLMFFSWKLDKILDEMRENDEI